MLHSAAAPPRPAPSHAPYCQWPALERPHLAFATSPEADKLAGAGAFATSPEADKLAGPHSMHQQLLVFQGQALSHKQAATIRIWRIVWPQLVGLRGHFERHAQRSLALQTR